MKQESFGTIGVLMGGYSSEREVSLKSGKAVSQALQEQGCDVRALDINVKDEREIFDLIKNTRIDIAFITLHGRLGEDGIIQGILEKAKIPYTGSGVQASQLALDKTLTQKILKDNGIPIPSNRIVAQGSHLDVDEIWNALNNAAVIIKPACEGSSIGITVVQHKEDFKSALDQAFRYGPKALIEQYINGRELTVGVLAEKALPIVEIRPKSGFFDFTSKYQKGMSEYIVPAEIPNDVAVKIQALALKAHRALKCRHLSRVDLILDKNMNPFFLEVNTIPGFTATSLLPMAAKSAGMNFNQLCLTLVKLAYEQKK